MISTPGHSLSVCHAPAGENINGNQAGGVLRWRLLRTRAREPLKTAVFRKLQLRKQKRCAWLMIRRIFTTRLTILKFTNYVPTIGRKGHSYSLQEFHDAFLSEVGVPIKLIRKVLMAEYPQP